MLILRLARRDLRGGTGGFRLLVLCVALGTAGIAAIGLLSAMVLDGVGSGARESIGGDVSLRLFHEPPRPEDLAAFAAAGTASLTAELRPVARHAGRPAGPEAGHSILVELKAVDDAYPLYGRLLLDPPLPPAEAFGRRDGVPGAAVAASLFEETGAALGDVVTVGGLRFELRAIVVEEPDRALRAFSLGPRMIIALPEIMGSDLVAPGTQTYWYSRIRLDPGQDAAAWIADFERAFPEAGFRIVNADDGVPGFERSLALVSTLLLFAAMGVLLVGAVGVGGSVAGHLERKRDTIAILKSLGAGSALVRGVYLVQILLAALMGVAAGLAAGTAAALAVAPGLAEWLPVEPGVRLRPLLVAGGFGLLVALLFALWPLGKAERVPPSVLFRAVVVRPGGRPGLHLLLLVAAIALATGALMIWAAPLPVAAGAFLGAAAVVVLCLLLFGRIVVALAKRAGRFRLSGLPVLRLALAGMHRPGAPTAPVVMATGLCLTLLVAVVSLRDNAVRHLAGTLPETAPDLVLLNLPPEAGERLDAVLAGLPEVRAWERMPFLHGTVSRIGGRPVSELRIPADIRFVIRGDRGLSWRDTAPPQGVTAGRWWPADYTGPPLVSLDRRVAQRLGLAPGDRLTLTILGKPVEATIANLREVDWAALDLDFPILLSPPAEPPLHREIVTIRVAAERGHVVRTALAGAFPEAPVVNVHEIVGFLGSAVDGAGRILTAAAAASGVAALLVLGGAGAAGRRRRNREAVVMKVLGATRRQLVAASALEFALVGIVTALLALVLGTAAAWAAVGDFLAFRPAPGSALSVALVVVLVMAAVGTAAGWRALAGSTAQALRRD